MMNKRKLLSSSLVFATLFLLVLPTKAVKVKAENGLPYATYTYSSAINGLVRTQDAYLPLLANNHLGGESLLEPSDITIDHNDIVYVADTGHQRVVQYDLRTDVVHIIGDGILNQPRGVHVDIENSVYVADTGNKKVYKFGYNPIISDYEVITTYERPVGTPYFSDLDTFEPTKVVTDLGLNVYIVLAGNINGLAQFKNDGQFFGYFGGNHLPETWDNFVRSVLFNEEQRRKWFQLIPKPVYNLAVDQNGLILTTTRDQPGYLKLNIANEVYNESVWGFSNNEDLFVGPYNTTFTLSSDGYIVEYDPNGSTLFIFGGKDQYDQKGLFDKATAIAVDSKNNIYALDSKTNALFVYKPTSFATLVHDAINLYFEGHYVEALLPWQEVLRKNRLFDLANQGIGDAYYAQGEYRLAMQYYELARNREGYSDAFWEVRNEYLLHQGGAIIVFVLIGIIVLAIANKFYPFLTITKQKVGKLNRQVEEKSPFYTKLLFPFRLFKKPIDGYYDLKREKASSNLVGFIYLGLFFFSYILNIYATNFLFNNHIVAEIDLFEEIIRIFVPFTLWVLANYLVSSIRDGEGKLKDIFQATSITLLPMIIVYPILVILSYGLTYNEAFVYDLVLYLGLAFTGVYLFLMVKEIHFYDIKPTIKNILITLFTAIMIMAVVIIVYFLLNEVVGVIIDIIQEAIAHG